MYDGPDKEKQEIDIGTTRLQERACKSADSATSWFLSDEKARIGTMNKKFDITKLLLETFFLFITQIKKCHPDFQLRTMEKDHKRVRVSQRELHKPTANQVSTEHSLWSDNQKRGPTPIPIAPIFYVLKIEEET